MTFDVWRLYTLFILFTYSLIHIIHLSSIEYWVCCKEKGIKSVVLFWVLSFEKKKSWKVYSSALLSILQKDELKSYLPFFWVLNILHGGNFQEYCLMLSNEYMLHKVMKSSSIMKVTTYNYRKSW